jgi:hypothetical protein
MPDHAELALVPMATDSHAADAKPRPKAATFDPVALQQIPYWTVPETAFMCRIAVRTVWRLMADPHSGFPRPRHVRGRTLLARDEVFAYLAKAATR